MTSLVDRPRLIFAPFDFFNVLVTGNLLAILKVFFWQFFFLWNQKRMFNSCFSQLTRLFANNWIFLFQLLSKHFHSQVECMSVFIYGCCKRYSCRYVTFFYGNFGIITELLSMATGNLKNVSKWSFTFNFTLLIFEIFCTGFNTIISLLFSFILFLCEVVLHRDSQVLRFFRLLFILQKSFTRKYP